MNKDLDLIIKKEFDEKEYKLLKTFEGNTHLFYLISIEKNSYVVRIAKKEHKKFDTEIWALKQFPKWNISGPKLIAYDKNKKTIKYNYTIETFVTGLHPETNNLEAFKSLSEVGLFSLHKRNIKQFGDINSKGIGEYKTWIEYLQYKYNKAFPNLKTNKLVDTKTLNTIEYIWIHNQEIFDLKQGKLLFGDLHNKNFFVDENNNFKSFIDYKSILSGDPIWDYSLNYYYNEIFIIPSYIEINNIILKKFYYYCILISMNKIWYSYKINSDYKLAKKKLNLYIDEFNKLN